MINLSKIENFLNFLLQFVSKSNALRRCIEKYSLVELKRKLELVHKAYNYAEV
jgi:hypothetical protein